MTVKQIKSCISKTIIIGSTMFLWGIGPAMANVSAEATNLLKAGKPAEALNVVEGALKQNPKDAQLRFLKGVIFSEQNRTADAINVFTKLTEDYPNLPEPYNNLAVLYAANNQFEKARIALDKAIRTNPTYAIAYENLGDVHAKLASQAYDKALQLDSSNTAAKSKLTMVKSLVATAPVAQPAGNPGTSTVNIPQQPSQSVAASNTKPAAPVTVPEKTKPADDKKQVAQAPSRQEPKTPAASSSADQDAVLSVVNQWAKAWSAKDVKGYLGFYGSDFVLPKGMTRKSWAEERQARIAGKGRISVKVESPQVTVKGNIATVKFRQLYQSDRLTANSRKTLVLVKQGSRWQIQQEQTGA